MFITENVNYNDSVLFLLSARMALKESIELSSIESKDRLKEFILKEASDYQVMSLLVDGVLPEEKQNKEAERIIFSRLKEQLIFNYDIISEVISSTLTNNIIFEVDSIYPKYSTSSIYMESLEDSGKLGSLLKEDTPDENVDSGEYETSKITPQATGDSGEYSEPKAVAAKGGNWIKTLSKYKEHIAAGILATIAIYAGYKAYQRFFSKAAKACKGKSSAEKTACMNKFKTQAIGAQVKELKKGLSACSKSSNPAKCKTVVNNKIARLKSKQAG